MSGDVFGNGMLLSPHIKLVAAFDHRHVFLDPDPDPTISFAERQRLFALPRSSWADYDTSLISEGGGVWPRTAKSVPIYPQVRAALGLDPGVTALTPAQLISAVLAAPADLLWNGGIGTYVKASTETQAAAGDRSNDGIRIDAPQLRVKVVGEGGNLGLTQAARIEFALGRRPDQHRLHRQLRRRGHLGPRGQHQDPAGPGGPRRADDHAAARRAAAGDDRRGRPRSCCRTTTARTWCWPPPRAQAGSMLHVHARYLRKLERDGRIRRRLEVLPGDKEIAERRAAGHGLTSPEFAVLLAHTKIDSAQEVLGLRPARRPRTCARADRVLPRAAARAATSRTWPRTRCAARSSPPSWSTRWSTSRASRSGSG